MQPGITKVIQKTSLTVNHDSASLSTVDRVKALLGIVQEYHRHARTSSDIQQMVYFCCQALELTQRLESEPLLQARSLVALGTVLRCLPDRSSEVLVEARMAYEQALSLLQEHADLVEIATAYLHLGCVLQALMADGLAQLEDVIEVHSYAQRIFTSQDYPREHALLQNNLAIAYLALPCHHPLRPLAIAIFRQALRHISLTDCPWEYALLHNNLGNALQCLSGYDAGGANSWHAIAAYDEALKVRNCIDTPLDFADTLAGKANALAHLVDDNRNPNALCYALQARNLLLEAKAIFHQHQQRSRVQAIALSLAELDDLLAWELSA